MKIIFPILLLLLPWPSYAEIYKWVDADGNVNYSDRPTRNSKEIKIQKPNITQAPPARSNSQSSYQAPSRKKVSKPAVTSKRPAQRKSKTMSKQEQKKFECLLAKGLLQFVELDVEINNSSKRKRATQAEINKARRELDKECRGMY